MNVFKALTFKHFQVSVSQFLARICRALKQKRYSQLLQPGVTNYIYVPLKLIFNRMLGIHSNYPETEIN